jgi:hypothetical protein
MKGRIKEMSYKKKYAKAITDMKFNEEFTFPFVEKHMGKQATDELIEAWGKGIIPIPRGAPFEMKYNVAHRDWIWMTKSTYEFIREQMGEESIKKFERAEIEALKKKNAVAAVLLKLVRSFLPGTAFTMTVKQIGYELQWRTPFSVSELTRDRAVVHVPRCKILDFPNTDDICLVGCQNTYPTWMAEQFMVKIEFCRQGNSCTGTLTPLR